MPKKLILISFALVLVFSQFQTAYTQENQSEYHFRIGDQFTSENKQNNKLLLKDETGYLLRNSFNSASRNLYLGDDKVIFTRLDENLNLIKESELKLKSHKHDNIVNQVVEINGKVLVFYTKRESKIDGTHIYCQSLNPKSLELNEDELEITYIIFRELTHLKWVEGRLRISSFDEKISLEYSYSLGEKKGGRIHTFILSNDLDIIQSDIYDENQVGAKRGMLLKAENRSIFYTASQLVNSKRDSEHQKSEICLASYGEDGSEKLVPLNLGDILIQSPIFNTEKENVIALSGQYLLPESAVPEGVFLVQYDTKEKRVTSTNKIPFSENLKNELYSDQELKRGVIIPYTKVELHPFMEGFVILIEPSKKLAYSSGSGSINDVSMEFGAIIMFYMNSEGELIWNKDISKNQLCKSSKEDQCSFTYFSSEDEAYILYNDNRVNTVLTDTPEDKTQKSDNALMLVRIDEKGNMSKEVVEEYSKKKMVALAVHGIELKNQILIPYIMASKTYKYKLIDLN